MSISWFLTVHGVKGSDTSVYVLLYMLDGGESEVTGSAADLPRQTVLNVLQNIKTTEYTEYTEKQLHLPLLATSHIAISDEECVFCHTSTHVGSYAIS